MIWVVMDGVRVLLQLLIDAAAFARLLLRPRGAIAAENLFLRKQLAMYRQRGVKPRRPDVAARVSLVVLSMCFDWRDALAVVTPRTLMRWHRIGFRLFWRWKVKQGRPPIPAELRVLIRRMANENPTWGEERIANELLLKLGLRVSPRTVRKYMPKRPKGVPRGDQRWLTFVRNHAQAIVACDFCVAVTATFQLLYVFVVLEHGSRRVLHTNVTRHPTAHWTLQQLREAIPSDHPYRYLIHDRDNIFSAEPDTSVANLRLKVLRTPYRAPQANAHCERLLGSLRRECLDFVIPLGEGNLRRVVKEWAAYYNSSRPHMSLGPGVPDPPASIPAVLQSTRHRIRDGSEVIARSVLGGLHHDYALAPV